MAKAGFYAVAKGRVPGIYASWDDCEAQVKGFIGAKYKKFRSLREAEEFAGISSSTSTASSRRALPASSAMSRPQASVAPPTSNVNVSSDSDVCEEGYDVVYSDGACKGNGQAGSIAGIGVWWGHNDPRNLAERCPGAQTNNRAELIAIVRVLEETSSCARPLVIKTDSTYSIRCVRDWHQSWAHRDWKTSTGKPVLNVGIIRYLLALLSLRDVQGFPVKFVYVKGHAGIRGNEGADAQANIGACLPGTPERDWDAERARVEKLTSELQDSVEVVDKSIQVETVSGDEDRRKGVGELDSEALDALQPTEKVVSSVVACPTNDLSNVSIHEPQTSIVVDGEEYSVDDLLSQEELAAELAETLR